MLNTLTDLADSMNSALARFGFPTHPADSYRYLIGDGTEHLVRSVLPKDHLNDRTVSKCLTAMQAEYRKRWADNTSAYPGVPELLSALQERSIPKAVLSNKPDEFARVTVEKLLSRWSFEVVQGVKPSVPPKPDPAAALQIADELKIPPQKFLYLGDTDIDMQTANSAGMYAVGALWGFRTAEELQENGAMALVKTPQDVLNFFTDDSS